MMDPVCYARYRYIPLIERCSSFIFNDMDDLGTGCTVQVAMIPNPHKISTLLMSYLVAIIFRMERSILLSQTWS